MEYQLFQGIVQVLSACGKGLFHPVCVFQDAEIVKVWYWAVIHDRPVSWACQRENWPIWRRTRLPSESTMSRRLRSRSVLQLLEAVERHVTAPKRRGLFWKIDGKPLPIGGCSKDRQAGYGRAANGKAKGYKLHAIIGAESQVGAWRIAPMNKDERVMSRRMLKTASLQGYVVADSNYDSNKVHATCDERGSLQLLTPRRYGPGHGTGHRKQTAGRLRSISLVESPCPAFAAGLLKSRNDIERDFGNLTNWSGGLNGLPPWIRTHRRVHRWVQAKLTLTALQKRIRNHHLQQPMQ
jgi:hypothetical protein